MTKWDYQILETWWVESGRSDDYLTRIQYRHVWQPGDEVQEFASGMSAHLGVDGWELVTITSSSVSLLTIPSPQGNDAQFPSTQALLQASAVLTSPACGGRPACPRTRRAARSRR